MDLPTGTVTFPLHRRRRLDSTREGARSVPSAALCSRRTGGCCNGAFRDAGGVEVDSAGDGFFVAFRQRGRRGAGSGGDAARPRGAWLARGRSRSRADGHPHGGGGGA